MLIWRRALRRCLRWAAVVFSEGDSASDRLPCQFCCRSVRTGFQSKPLRADSHLKSRFSALMMWPFADTLHSFSRQAAHKSVARGRGLTAAGQERMACARVSVRRLSLGEFMSAVSEHSRPNVQSFITLPWSHDGKKASLLLRRRVFRHFCYYD